MSDFIVHSVPGSPYGRAVLVTLEEKGAGYRVMRVAPGGARSEPHIARHPFGKVPVLEHGDFMLYETQAILRYLDRVLANPPLTPADARVAARMDQVMNICDWYLMQGVGNVIGFQRIVGPRLFGLVADENAIAAAMPQAHVVFKVLSELLGTKAFLCGETVTLADLMVAPHLDFLVQTPEWAPLAAAAPNLVPWLGRMNTRASMEKTTWARVNDRAQSV